MPANLTPQYEKAEQSYREATSDEERLDALREMLRSIPKHKGTEKMQADIKRRISEFRKGQKKKASAKGFDPYHVPKAGAGQVVLVGGPNVGKSMIVATTTNAPVKVAEYPFTTALPVPGMWAYEDAQIELVDTPPITPEHVPGGLVGTIRKADTICVVVDASTDPLEGAEMVLNLLTDRGIKMRSAARSNLDATNNEQSGIIVANKIDIAPAENIAALKELYTGKLDVYGVSAATGEGMDRLLKRLWELLAVIRVYTKQPGKPPDKDKPFTLPIGSTVEDLAREIHRELPEKMKRARLWGEGRYEGQQVHRTETLRDKDIVEIRE